MKASASRHERAAGIGGGVSGTRREVCRGRNKLFFKLFLKLFLARHSLQSIPLRRDGVKRAGMAISLFRLTLGAGWCMLRMPLP